MSNYLTELLIFNDLTPSQLELVQPLFEPLFESMGNVIFEQGNQAEYLYLLANGEVSIRYKPEDGPILTIARIHPQGVVGWSAALGNFAYTSTAVCATDCQLLRVRRTDLRNLCENYPETGNIILDLLADAIAERIRNTHTHVVALLRQGLRLTGSVYKPLSSRSTPLPAKQLK